MKIKKRHKLRKPTGMHEVGCINIAYGYDPEGTGEMSRIIPCLCFYPAGSTRRAKPKKYVNERLFPGTKGIKTNAFKAVQVLEGEHPLLVFSSGFSMYSEANTVQMEELASHGYMVLAVGHQGAGSYELADGTLLFFDRGKITEKFQEEAAKGMDMLPRYISWIGGEGKDAGLDEHAEYYGKLVENQSVMVAESEIWLKDSLAALEMFMADSDREDGFFSGRLDRDRIGAFGMSLGGAVAVDLARSTEHVKAAAYLDGFYYSRSWKEPIEKPVMLVQNDSQLAGHFLTYPFLNAKGDSYLATVKNTTQGNFMDYNEILADNPVSRAVMGGQEVEWHMLGKIDPEKMETILNGLLLDFFGKYIKGEPSRLIDTGELPEEVALLRK